MTPNHNDNELNEEELRELLKPHEPSPMPGDRSRRAEHAQHREAPRKAPAEPRSSEPSRHRSAQEPHRQPASEPARGAGVSEKRKSAVVWYLVGLFGIAFILVLGSLWLRGSSDPDLENRVQTMQEQLDTLAAENRELTTENENLAMQISTLEHNMLEMAGNAEYIEGQASMSDSEAKLLSRKMKAYSLLVQAQNAMLRHDQQTVLELMDQMLEDDTYTYLDSEGLNAYYNVMEFMEQPSMGR